MPIVLQAETGEQNLGTRMTLPGRQLLLVMPTPHGYLPSRPNPASITSTEMKYLVRIFAFCIGLTAVWQEANAQIILDFTRTDTGGVRVRGTGTGRTTGFGWSSNWNILDFNDDFISDSIGTTSPIVADSVTGTISNSWGISRNINGFSINRSATSNDDVQFQTQGNMFFWVNQPYSFTIEAIFDAGTLSINDLIEGAYVDNTASGGTEIFRRTRINVSAVPEPATGLFIVAGAGLFGLLIYTKKRKKKTSGCHVANALDTPHANAHFEVESGA